MGPALHVFEQTEPAAACCDLLLRASKSTVFTATVNGLLQAAVDSPELKLLSDQLASGPEGVQGLLVRHRSVSSYLAVYELFAKRFPQAAQEAKLPGVRSVPCRDRAGQHVTRASQSPRKPRLPLAGPCGSLSESCETQSPPGPPPGCTHQVPSNSAFKLLSMLRPVTCAALLPCH